MKKIQVLRQKIKEIDELFTKIEDMRNTVLRIMSEKDALERQIVKLFRKLKHVHSIETVNRVYRVEKKVEKDVREKVIEHLSNHLLEQGVHTKAIHNIDQWKRKMFKPKKKSKLVVLRKV